MNKSALPRLATSQVQTSNVQLSQKSEIHSEQVGVLMETGTGTIQTSKGKKEWKSRTGETTGFGNFCR